MNPTSIGVVEPKTFRTSDTLSLENGDSLAGFELVYETYGKLNKDHSNAVLICHALSGHHHAAGYHDLDNPRSIGWWDNCIGPGKPIDTNQFFVVALNNLGGCHGSTGPTTINPATNKPFGSDFPGVTVKDWVSSQAMLSDHLEIESWCSVIGGSLGGMQALQWAIDHPNRVKSAALIACAPFLSAQNIAFNEIARNAILTDSNYHQGGYLVEKESPAQGLGTARMLGHVTYLSEEGMTAKFGAVESPSDMSADHDVVGEVSSYLQYNGQKFANMFDANTYLLMTHALDQFNPAAEFGNDLIQAFNKTSTRFFVVSFTTDWRFPPERSREIVDAIVAAGRDASYVNVESIYGHDSFLLEIPRYHSVFRSYMNSMAREIS